MSSQGKAGGQTGQTNDYYGSVYGLVCAGPVSGLWAVIIDGKQAWPLTPEGAPAHVVIRPGDPGNTDANGAYKIMGVAGFGDVFFYWGRDTQLPHPNLFAAEPHPAYRGWCYFVAVDCQLGRERQEPPNMEFIIERAPYVLNAGGTATVPDTLSADGQANPLAIVQEALTNPRFGFDLPPAELTAADWAPALATVAVDNRNLISLVLDGQQPARQLAAEMGDLGEFRVIAAGRQFGAVAWRREGQDITPATLPVITADQLTESPKIRRNLPASLPNLWRLIYDDRERRFAKDAVRGALVDARALPGGNRAESLDRPQITIRTQAQAWLESLITRRGRPRRACSLSVRRGFAAGMSPGSVFRLDVDVEPGGAQLLAVVRVDRVTFPAGNRPAQVECTEELSFAPVAVTLPSPSDATPFIYPAPFVSTRAVEAPPQLNTYNTQRLTTLAARTDLTTLGHGAYGRPVSGEPVLFGWQRQLAVRGLLNAAITETDALVSIQFTSQAPNAALDESFLLQTSPGDVSASNNDLLAIIIQCTDATYATVAEDPTSQIVEFCAISSTAKVNARLWTLNLLRGRLGWKARAFTPLPPALAGGFAAPAPAPVEIWIVRRTELPMWQHQRVITPAAPGLFVAGDPFDFRLVPFNSFVASDVTVTTPGASNYPGPDWRSFVFGEAPYLPIITFGSSTPPTSPSLALSTVYPFDVLVSDLDSNLVRVAAYLVTPDGLRVLLFSRDMASTATAAFNGTFTTTAAAGIYTLAITAADSTGHVTELLRRYTVNPGSALLPPTILPASSFYAKGLHVTLQPALVDDAMQWLVIAPPTGGPDPLPGDARWLAYPAGGGFPPYDCTVYARTNNGGSISPTISKRTYSRSGAGGSGLPQ